MENKNDFPQGIIAKKGNVDFVKARLSFKIEEFTKWMQENSNKGWVNIDVLESKQGNLYTKLNTFEPKTDIPDGIKADENEDDLPF